MIEHSYKADSDLSMEGIQYAERLRDFIVEKRRELQEERVNKGEDFEERKLTIFTASRRRCLSTARPLAELGKVVERSQLNELNPGIIDGLSQAEIREKYPDEFEIAQKNPYRCGPSPFFRVGGVASC